MDVSKLPPYQGKPAPMSVVLGVLAIGMLGAIIVAMGTWILAGMAWDWVKYAVPGVVA